MKAKIEIEIDVTDFVEDENLTIPDAEGKIREIVQDMFCDNLQPPDKISITIE